ncbi:MAG: hypothetical protein J6W08_02545, partial [Alphaproteobacteria bacterium]|nr:hypothetical protein [Alphaproteobacteria bacterium]
MTDNDIRQIITNTIKLLNTMDREHIKRLLCVLLNIKEDKETLDYFTQKRKTLRQMLRGYENA